MRKQLLLSAVIAIFMVTGATAGPRDNILAELNALAKANDATFTSFSAARGKTLFLAKSSSGKPETPSCTTCHSSSPTKAGETRAGKVIDPIAVSRTPDRFTDPKKVNKWFRRNCNSVLGRECTALEKGDFLTFMISQ